MPASAHDRGASPETPQPASHDSARVYDLTARRAGRTAPSPAGPPSSDRCAVTGQGMGPEAAEAARASAGWRWEAALEKRGTSLSDPVARAAVLGVADLLARAAYGAMVIRSGDPARGIPASPDDGMDRASAQTLIDLLQDLRDAAGDTGCQ